MGDIEIFKAIQGYEGHYEISSHGRVKSLKCRKEIILKPCLRRGYLAVSFFKNKKRKTHAIHQLLSIAFLGHIPCGQKIVIDHVDNNPLNNHVSNLQLITCRENCSKDKKGGSSKYLGVCWHKRNKRWYSEITINGKQHHLGVFTDELEAANAYQRKLYEINN